MNRFKKGALAFASLATIGIATAYLTLSPAEVGASPTAAVETRFPAPSDMFVPLEGVAAEPFLALGHSRRGAQPMSAECRAQTWPYIRAACLQKQDGRPAKVSRIVSAEGWTAPAAGR